MVRTAGVNLAWQTGHDAELMAAACEGADVVFACEALTLNAEGPLDLRKILPIGWAVFQDLSSAARAGSAVCWRTSTMAEDGPGELLAGSPAGGGTRARHIASRRLRERATGDSRPYAAFHAPKRSTDLQDEFYANLDRYAAAHPRAVLGGDCNRPPSEVATLLGRRAVQSEVMGIFHPANVPARALTPQDVAWSDHPIIRATLTLPEAPVTGTPKTDALIAALRRRGVEVLTHAQWGSLQAPLYRQRLTSHPHGLLPGQPVDTLWNHITVTSDDGPLIGDFKADMREVERIGVSRFGSGFSYNFGVDANADRPRLALGQFLEAKGTHTVNDKGTPGYSYNQNKVALAVAWVGMPGNKLNTHAVNAIVQLNAALIEVGAMTNHYDNVPHSLVAAKDCPTSELRDRLAEIKRRALLVVKPSAPAPAPVAPKITDADMTRLAGAIRNARLVAQEVHEKDPTETYVLGIHRQLRAPFDAAAAKSSKF